jgi:hypothetical protein
MTIIQKVSNDLSADNGIQSPQDKISQQDEQFFQTILKINEKIDNDLLRSTQDCKDNLEPIGRTSLSQCIVTTTICPTISQQPHQILHHIPEQKESV